MTPPGDHPTPEQKRKQRQVLVGAATAIVVIGVVGVLVAINVDPEPVPAVVGPEPAPTVNPLSALGKCQADRAVTYVVVHGARTTGEITATAAVGRWLLAGEASTSTSTGPRSKLVSLGLPGAPPREVLTVRKATDGWSVAKTTACLDELGAGKKCPTETLIHDGTTYTREESQGTGVAAYVGQVSVQTCVVDDVTSYAARGAISPVTAYTANEQPASEALVITEGDAAPYLFVPKA
ncbi:MAG: hypothetical protein JWQ74_1554 [Marmoricola sp.]|nr:hypothetical protein [Marmoricola sp.]